MEFEARVYGKYFLLDKIATGGMAEVFKAKTFGVRGFERLLVIKQILPHLTKDREFVDMFIDEAKISVELSHANIVQVFDLGKIGSNYFIAMEYIDGKDLRALLKKSHAEKRPLSVSQAVFIMIEVLKGLEYAHKKRDAKTSQPLNIIHRDISPQNVVISYDGEVKVVDFGIAKAERRLNETQAGVLKGKFGYMSPEQAMGYEMDSRSDLFACGILLFEMLSGRRLFMGENDLETLELIREADVPSITKYNPSTPKELEEIVYKSLKREAGERYQEARAMQLELTKFMFQYDPNFTSADLSTHLSGLFEKERQAERVRLDRALEAIEEKYKISSNKDGAALVGDNSEEVSFVHPRFGNAKSEKQTDITEAENLGGARTASGKTPMPPKSQGGSGSGKRPMAEAQTQYQPKTTTQSLGGNWNAEAGGTATRPTGLHDALRPWLKPLIFLACILILVWFNFFRGDSPESGEPKSTGTKSGAVVRGTIDLNSEPAGAEIFVQDKLYGTTPITLELDADKDQSFLFKLAGYRDRTMTVYLAKGVNTPLQVKLESQQPLTSSLRLNSNPPGASVYLNGEDTGKRTPYTFDNLPRGKEIAVRLHRRGYEPQDLNVMLDTGEVERSFEMRAKRSTVTIDSEPERAQIYLNGKKLGTAPVTTEATMDQDMAFTAKLKGYKDTTQSLHVNEEGESLRIVLKAVEVEYGFVSINADPWAMVYIDGELIGHTPILKTKVPVGEHNVDFQHTDYGSKRERVSVGKSNTVDQPLLIIRDMKK